MLLLLLFFHKKEKEKEKEKEKKESYYGTPPIIHSKHDSDKFLDSLEI